MRKRSSNATTSPETPERGMPNGAAEWVARMASDQRTRDDDRMLQEWLAQDATHVAEFDAHAAIFNGIGTLASDDEARAILMNSRLISAASRGPSRRLFLYGGLSVAAAVAVATVIGAQIFGASKTFTTKPGEQRRFQLADSSTVMLNTNSSLRVQFVKTERRTFLDRGQAWFQVAKEPDRPFRVFVGKDEVRALGTAFDVRREGDIVKVTLEEGKVAIFRNASRNVLSAQVASPKPQSKLMAGDIAPTVVLQPGKEARLIPSKALDVVAVNLAQSQAWRSGRVILDATPLGDAVEDFNRYGGQQIVLDPSLTKLPVSGVFYTSRPEAFAESVTAAFPIRATIADGKIVLARR